MARPRPPAVWFTEERPRRPRLTRDRIAQAAVELLDAEGLAGFSMRRLAARLGAGAMSVYEYVGGREDVLDLAVDRALGEVEDVDEVASWREALTRHLVSSRAVMQRHPWLPALAATRPLVGPNALARSELFYARLVAAGLRGPRLVAAVGTLAFYVQGFVAAETTWRRQVRDPATETELRRQTSEFVAAHAGRYPTLARHAQLENDDFDGLFLLGVETILDGVEAGLDRQPEPRRDAPPPGGGDRTDRTPTADDA